ncbi:lumazine synthase [Dimargaris cristalligena]|uniref:6,7-dimethyl-8-ribityllumazine synthase n=1 Tax=Dimargaris cristalligena TaxID=215637 RepID=A0A4P9ZZJ5_9FUNG|nr:lumazine synthase [Dimargaris cristalligena]RKP39204.1 6,7-dimethyl-8-ribityllumazine synthase [Dimargaris cristalligena]|eukprot:RKP39204.1 6,7-dimethyl-8-ribityllumazine synthase [Dimargaris cristalligena]
MTDFAKGLKASDATIDGSNLRILIVHGRWNAAIVDALVTGAKDTMTQRYGVQSQNIIVQSVPGAYELPFAAQRLIQQSQQRSQDLIANVTDSMANLMDDLMSSPKPTATTTGSAATPSSSSGGAAPRKLQGPFDAVICIGVLIKGSTMHFEYICEAVSHGITRVGLDTGVPVIFGVLTCLDDDQALERAALGKGADKGHNHGEDWGAAAVEMATLKL